MYLARFGYMDPASQNPSSGALISGETVRRAIIDFQSFAGLNQTGKKIKIEIARSVSFFVCESRERVIPDVAVHIMMMVWWCTPAASIGYTRGVCVPFSFYFFLFFCARPDVCRT